MSIKTNISDRVIFWRHTEHRDGEVANSQLGDMKLFVMDCDGDASDWSIERDGVCLARDTLYQGQPYHFDAAKVLVETVARAIARADEHNSFMRSDTWLKGCLHCGYQEAEHPRPDHCDSYVAPRRRICA